MRRPEGTEFRTYPENVNSLFRFLMKFVIRVGPVRFTTVAHPGSSFSPRRRRAVTRKGVLRRLESSSLSSNSSFINFQASRLVLARPPFIMLSALEILFAFSHGTSHRFEGRLKINPPRNILCVSRFHSHDLPRMTTTTTMMVAALSDRSNARKQEQRSTGRHRTLARLVTML